MAALAEARQRAETFRPEVKAKVSIDKHGLVTVSFSPEVSFPKYMLEQRRGSEATAVKEEVIKISEPTFEEGPEQQNSNGSTAKRILADECDNCV